MNAMILAAGRGERLRPYTDQQAKPSIPFLNIPLIGYAYYYLEQLGIDGLVINTHHLPESIRQAVARIISPRGPSPQWTFESPELLGSGGGIKLAEPLLRGKDNFLVANGDEMMIAPRGLKEFWNHHLRSGALATLFVCHHEEVGQRFGGVWVTDQNQVLGFGKKPLPQAKSAHHFTGFIALADRAFDYIPQGIASNLLYDGLTKAIQNGEHVQAYEQEVVWYETGNETDFLNATSLCLNHLQQDNVFGSCLRNIMNRYHPGLREFGTGIWRFSDSQISSSAQISGPCFIGKGAFIGDHVVIDGNVVIGNHATIKEKVRLRGSVVGPEVSIESQQSLENCLIL